MSVKERRAKRSDPGGPGERSPHGITRRVWFSVVAVGGLSLAGAAWWMRRQEGGVETERTLATLYASRSCDCCRLWARRMEDAGFRVETSFVNDPGEIKRKYGVPAALQSCHTALVGRYVVEGHVPPVAIRRLLVERPAVRGLAVPGMPGGSPGMESAPAQPFDVISFSADGTTQIFARG